jgi:hypothetical protein
MKNKLIIPRAFPTSLAQEWMIKNLKYPRYLHPITKLIIRNINWALDQDLVATALI